jgi:IS6 family transposase
VNRRSPVESASFAGYRFPPDVILLAVRWYLRYGLSYRDMEELLAERGIEVDHVTIYRWVQRFTPELIDVYVSKRGNLSAARSFFTAAVVAHGRPTEITTDLAAPLLRVVDELLPDVVHDTEQYSNNRIEQERTLFNERNRAPRRRWWSECRA